MTIFRESPLIQELLTQERQLGFEEGRQEGEHKGRQEGRQEGEQKGRQEGWQEGEQKGERNATLKALRQILTIRFDPPPPPDFERRLEPLDLLALQQLTTAALTLPTLPEFEQKVAEEIRQKETPKAEH